MKLKEKFVLLVAAPVVLLGIAVYLLSSVFLTNGINEQAYDGMQATSIAVRQMLEIGSSGDYWLDGDGKLWRGNKLCISDSYNMAESIRKETGFDVTIFYGDTRYLTTIKNEAGERQIGTKASDIIIDSVLMKGNDYYGNDVDVLGERYICYYVPLRQPSTGTITGMVFLGEKYSEVEKIIFDARIRLLLSSVAVLIAACVLAILVASKLVKFIKGGISCIEQISEGDIRIQIDHKLLDRKDEIGSMCRAIRQLDSRLEAIVSQIKQQCETLTKSSSQYTEMATVVQGSMEQLDATVQSIAQSTTMQAQETTEAGNHVVGMGETIQETTSKVKDVTEATTNMTKASEQAQEILKDLNQSMDDVVNSVSMFTKEKKRTNDAVNRISEMTVAITEIATQTNLLSLNASIEAARAGEQGRGFAVVAAEIQKLAEQSNNSAIDIQEILETLRSNSETSAQTIEEVKRIVEIQEDKLAHTNKIFGIVIQEIQKSVEGINIIQKSTEVLDKARTNTVKSVQNVAAIAQENAASTEESAASVDEVTQLITEMQKESARLLQVAETLENEIRVFRL